MRLIQVHRANHILLKSGRECLLVVRSCSLAQVVPGTLAAFAVAGVLDWLLVSVSLWRGVTCIRRHQFLMF